LNEAKQSIESKQSENQTILLQRLDQQDKEIKLLKTVFVVICGLIVIGTVATIFALNSQRFWWHICKTAQASLKPSLAKEHQTNARQKKTLMTVDKIK
jgi:hypothetical protein